MKLTIFIVLALSFALTKAAYIDPSANEVEDYIKSLKDFKERLTEISERVKAEVHQKHNEVLVHPRERVEKTIAEIEELSKDNEKCITQRKENIKGVVECFKNSIDICLDTAKLQVKDLLDEIKPLIDDITSQILALIKSIKKCNQEPNPIHEAKCIASIIKKIKPLIKLVKERAEEIIEKVRESLPKIVNDLEKCAIQSEESAKTELKSISLNVKSCVILASSD